MRLIHLLTLKSLLLLLIMNVSCDTAIPDDIREHTEVINSGEHTYEIVVDGTLEPENVEIMISSTGKNPVVNPRITVNGRYNFYTLEDMVAEITAGCETDEEKAWAIYEHVDQNYYWWSFPRDNSSYNPVRRFNVYGYHICAQAATQFVALCRAAGIDARVYETSRHTISEAWFDGDWRLMDTDYGIWYMEPDNRTVASIQDLIDNPDWIARTYKPYRWYRRSSDDRKIIYRPDTEPPDEWLLTLFKIAGESGRLEYSYDDRVYTDHDMNITLRPGESLVRWWKPVLGKYFDQREKIEPPRYANGRLIFQPDFGRYDYAESVVRSNVALYREDGFMPLIHVADPQDSANSKLSELVIPMASPYVMVGGSVETLFYQGGASEFYRMAMCADLDPNGDNVTRLWSYYPWGTGEGRLRQVLDEKMVRDGRVATYDFDVFYRFAMDKANVGLEPEYPMIYGGQSGIDSISITVDLQVNPSSLPALSLGRNVISYSDETEGEREVRITYKWRERTGQRKPHPPAEAISPKSGAQTESFAPLIEWSASEDPDGDRIVNYRFQLSFRPDCAWPLSTNFDRDIRDGRRFSVPPGWLNPSTTYYWRVRAEDVHGNLSSWSEIFSFITP